MSSRFFRAISDSDSDSSEEEELLSDEEQVQSKWGTKNQDDSDDSDDDEDSDEDESDDEPQQTRKPMSRFMRDASSDSESEEEVRKVIKSAKDKRLDEFEGVVHAIENAQRIDDWVTISKGMCLYSDCRIRWYAASLRPSAHAERDDSHVVYQMSV